MERRQRCSAALAEYASRAVHHGTPVHLCRKIQLQRDILSWASGLSAELTYLSILRSSCRGQRGESLLAGFDGLHGQSRRILRSAHGTASASCIRTFNSDTVARRYLRICARGGRRSAEEAENAGEATNRGGKLLVRQVQANKLARDLTGIVRLEVDESDGICRELNTRGGVSRCRLEK